MARRILLLAVALILCLPLVHVAVDEWGPKPQIDFNGAEWKARKVLIARAQVFVKSPPAIAVARFVQNAERSRSRRSGNHWSNAVSSPGAIHSHHREVRLRAARAAT